MATTPHVPDDIADAIRDAIGTALEPLVGDVRTVAEVAIARGSRLGELRVALTGAPDLPKAWWRDVARCVQELPQVERAVSVPPNLYITAAPSWLEELLGRVADRAGARQNGLGSVEPGYVVVFCSPNTNKPLHVGHMRACFLGMSLSRLLTASGFAVRRSQMLSNFGVHMCQALSMHDSTSTPSSMGVKPDWLVGDLYRTYHAALAEEPDHGCRPPHCAAPARWPRPCLRCRPLALLGAMRRGDPALLAANERLAEWAIDGITETQHRLGTSHDFGLRESETLALAEATIERAVAEGSLHRRADGSVYAHLASSRQDLTLLRRDGTSLVYSMLLGIYLCRAQMHPGWRVLEFTGEQWRAGRTAMYEVLAQIGRDDVSTSVEGVFFGMVKLEGSLIRSRSGGVLLVDDLLDHLAARFGDEARALSVLKYYVLGFPRREGFSFELAHVLSAAERFEELVSLVLRDEPATGQPSDHASMRALALTVARRGAIVNQAIVQRDPSIVVRHLDEIARQVRPIRRRDESLGALAAPVAQTVRFGLELLDVALPPATSRERERERHAAPVGVGVGS